MTTIFHYTSLPKVLKTIQWHLHRLQVSTATLTTTGYAHNRITCCIESFDNESVYFSDSLGATQTRISYQHRAQPRFH
ncbi:uncharacterized protein YALI1_F22701g [Yarrowia lipolytica]|uniref:Uncharacterized protein n=1 Tax=Yarrowia lipolytica TaxID=4952 RepID=A0A1D8NNT0_YARLL|nr:hypothetical protein YALI1_F22701g [Yarrowia lipolytica]